MPKLEITRAADGLDSAGYASLTIRTESLIAVRHQETPNTPGGVFLSFAAHDDIVVACKTAAQTGALYARIRDAM